MIIGLAKFVISKVLAVIIVLVLILSDELLRRRDTVESKRIFNLALLTGIGALLDLVTTYFDWNFFLEPRGKEVLVRAMVIAILCCAKEIIALQIVVGWNLHVDYAIYKSYDHVKKKQKKSFVPVAILSVIFIVAYVALSEKYVEGYEAVQVITAFTIICMGLQALYVISALQIVLKAQKGRKPPSFLRLDAFLVPVIVGFVLYYGPFFTQFDPRDICIAIGVVLTWRSVRNSYKYVDPHTGLYNRQFLSSMNEYMEKSGYPNGIGISFKAPGNGEKLIPVLNSIKPADAEIFSLGEDQFLVMAGPQSKSAIRLLIKAAKLKAKEADNSMEIESSYAIREKDESTEAFTKRLLDL